MSQKIAIHRRLSLYLSFVVFLALLSGFSSEAARPPAVLPQNLPPEVSRVITVTEQIVENQLRSQLDGSTSGYIVSDIQIETRNGFHVYADRLQFWTQTDTWLGEEWTIEILNRPNSTRFVDPVTKTLKEGYKGQSIFRVKLSPSHPVNQPPSLDHRIPFVTYFQACSDKVCLLPIAMQTDLALSSSGSAPIHKKSFLESSGDMIRSALGNSSEGLSWISVGIVLLAGVITAFTPCVYPLYPVTLGIFARWSHSNGANPLALALSYCAGLTLSYASIGLVTSATGTVFGAWTQTAPFLLGVGSLILLSALFFSGLFTFPMPDRLMQFFTKAEGPQAPRRSSSAMYAQAALMGTGLGVVASPCVGPVLVALLAWLGTAQASWAKGFFLLSVFGAGMSLPFLILGHFILRMGKRPSLGRYTPYVKNAGTALMAAASLFFLVPGFQLLRASSQSTMAMTFPISTLENWDKTKWSVLDFRADWCAACIELEHETFANSKISSLFDKGEWEMVRVDMTNTNESNTRTAQSFGVVSLPTVLISAPGGKICQKLSLFGFENAEQFAARLKSATAECVE